MAFTLGRCYCGVKFCMAFMEADLTRVLPPGSAQAMGRPALGVEKTTIRLPPALMARIDALMGSSRRRSQFIREAIEEKLAREEAEK